MSTAATRGRSGSESATTANFWRGVIGQLPVPPGGRDRPRVYSSRRRESGRLSPVQQATRVKVPSLAWSTPVASRADTGCGGSVADAQRVVDLLQGARCAAAGRRGKPRSPSPLAGTGRCSPCGGRVRGPRAAWLCRVVLPRRRRGSGAWPPAPAAGLTAPRSKTCRGDVTGNFPDQPSPRTKWPGTSESALLANSEEGSALRPELPRGSDPRKQGGIPNYLARC